ncbi:MAG TPA: YigZ family protein [Candidatus Lachnoclostridium stercorigallinarum]|uniref:YigZ family protein n=1 Tax=Candidatus Lachnoclostridium stercorigallinarum TaxID=2838634 RepID=A0A9D2GEU6_9FIRM|nr:YigZ family protein [Candidatus Lachnoclostridium stercorigallinarum]
MIPEYKILYEGGSGEITEKKSRFIATLKPVESEEEALAFVEEMKKKYWDATHNCSAFVIGERGELCRCSDDGEPSQTAGRPMLDVLLGEEIRNVCAVVTRYFGGTLLGTGGLVRAYSGAVKAGLENCRVVTKRLAKELTVGTDYSGVGKIQYLAAQNGITVLDSQYGTDVTFSFLVPVDEADRFAALLTEGTNGRCSIQVKRELYYGLLNKEILLF